MVKIVWSFLILGGIVLSIINNTIGLLTEAILLCVQSAVSMCVAMVGANCMFLGLMQILESTRAAQWLAGKMGRPLHFLFPQTAANSNAMQYIALNMITNMFGIGNAATPYGLKAMEALQKANKTPGVASDAMCMFALMNTASVQILPLSIITLRAAANAANPVDIVIPCFIVTVITAIVAMVGGVLCRRGNG